MADPKPVLPIGFFSYRHLDGADRAYLEKLWQNLQDELFTLTGQRIRIRRTACEIRAVSSSLMCWESIALSAATLPPRTQLRADLKHRKRLTMLMPQNFAVDLGNKQS